MRIRSVVLLVLAGVYFGAAAAPQEEDLKEFKELTESWAKALEGEGLVGRLHGVVPGLDQYVFTYRNPENFFDAHELSLVPASEEANALLKTLRRHDKIRLFGKLSKKPWYQPHIRAKKIEKITEEKLTFTPPPKAPQTLSAQDIQRFLEAHKRMGLKGVVHAHFPARSVLVLELAGMVFPVIYPQEQTPLFRSDKVHLKYELRKSEGGPSHLIAKSLKVIQPILPTPKKEGETKLVTMEGSLVLFPKSPQIMVDVYALRHVDGNGLALNYTLVNFQDQEKFKAIREHLAEIWKNHASNTRPGRNFWIQPETKIRVRGEIRVESPLQANPQIELPSPEAIEVE